MLHFRGYEWVSVVLLTFRFISGTWAKGPDIFWNVSGSLQGEEGEENSTSLRSLQRLLLGCVLCATHLPFAQQGK